MYLIITRSFPPEVGGMQNLMWGLANSLSKHKLIKVFADDYDRCSEFDKKLSYTIERISGPKFIRKYRKAYLVNDFIKENLNNKISTSGNNHLIFCSIDDISLSSFPMYKIDLLEFW